MSEQDAQSFYDQSSPDQSFVSHSVRSKFNQSRTGGEVKIDVQENDKYKNQPHYVQDDFNRIDKEIQQLDPDKIKRVHRFVESLVTGKYVKVNKNFDPSSTDEQEKFKLIDKSSDGIVSTQEIQDYEMKQQQKIWLNRINNIFNCIIGLLSGMSLLEFEFIIAVNNQKTFLQSYQGFAMYACIISQIFINFGMILGVTLTLIYKNKAEEQARNKEAHRYEFQQLYRTTLISTMFTLFAWVIVEFLPRQTNLILQNGVSISSQDFTVFQVLSIIKDVILIISWVITVFNNQSSIYDVQLEPDDNEQDDDQDQSTEDSSKIQEDDETDLM